MNQDNKANVNTNVNANVNPNADNKLENKLFPSQFLDQKKYENNSCAICLSLFNDPVHLVNKTRLKKHCGHVFCRGCITQSLNVDKRCPTCRQETQIQQIDEIPSVSRDIAGLRVKCDNAGCSWTGEIGLDYKNYLTHFNSCQFKKSCSYCSEVIVQSVFASHVEECKNKIIKCVICNAEVKACEKINHDKEFADVHAGLFVKLQNDLTAVYHGYEGMMASNFYLQTNCNTLKSEINNLKAEVDSLTRRNLELANNLIESEHDLKQSRKRSIDELLNGYRYSGDVADTSSNNSSNSSSSSLLLEREYYNSNNDLVDKVLVRPHFPQSYQTGATRKYRRH